METDGGRMMLTDRVGLVGRLPHFLVEAFRPTLEEVSAASAVLLLVDASLPAPRMALNCRRCFETLAELDVPDSRVMVAMSKSDPTTSPELLEKAGQAGVAGTVALSARTGEGMDELSRRLAMAVEGPRLRELAVSLN